MKKFIEQMIYTALDKKYGWNFVKRITEIKIDTDYTDEASAWFEITIDGQERQGQITPGGTIEW